MRYIVCLVLAVFCGGYAISQVGPGGVGTTATVAFWVDVHTNGGGNGFKVSTLNDYSGSNNDFVQATSANQPTYLSSAFNGIDAVDFNGDEWISAGAKASMNANTYFDFYMYGRNDDPSSLSIPLNYNYGPSRSIYTGLLGLSGFNRVFGHSAAYQGRRTTINSSSSFGLFHGTYDVPAGVLTAFFDFTQMSQITNAASPLPGTHVGFDLGGVNVTNGLDGQICEAFAFNVIINTAQERILQNYISAKYGTVIANDDYDFEAGHGFGLVGIGRDDNVNKHLNSIGNGMLRIEVSSLSDGDYLYVGHDDANPVSLTSADLPVVLAGGSRLTRTWRMDEPSDIGNIDITFALDASTNFSPDPLAYRLLVDDDGNFVNAGDFAGTYNALDNTVTFTGIDMDAGDYFTLAGDAPLGITSISNGLWSDPNSWNCTCVPTSINEVTINTTDTIEVDVDAFAQGLTVLGGIEWTTSNVLEIATDNLVIDGGDVDMPIGEILFSGSSTQTIDLKSDTVEFFDLEINNMGDSVKLLNGRIIMNGTLSPNSGVFDYTAAGITINSTSSLSSARVGPVNINAVLLGDATVRRFIPSGVAGNRNLASPVIGATLADWDDSLLISGLGFPDGCAFTAAGCYYSVKEYSLSNFNDVTSIGASLDNGRGYEIFLGDDLVTFSGATVSVTGSLNNTDVTTINPNGWGTFGNPYASPVLFSLASQTNIMGLYFYVFDAASGGYQWYDKVSNTSSIPELANGLIASGQGFWLKDFGFITFPQSSKTTSNATFIRNSEVENGLQLTLKQDNSTFFSVSSIGFNDQSNDADDQFDIHHLTTGLEQSSSLYMNISDSVQLTKNYLEPNGENKTIDFRMNCLNDGYYTINPSRISDLSDYEFVYLFDKQLNTMVDLSEEGSYSFYAEVGNHDRFALIITNDRMSTKTYIKSEGHEVVSSDDVQINQIGHAIGVITENDLVNGTMEVTNLLGQKIISDYALSSTNGKQYINISNEINGIYIVVVREEGQIVASKKIIL
ncbi:MAG: T9SS type A sorting domain-containing protein [Crocinitomicaceae bacterium]